MAADVCRVCGFPCIGVRGETIDAGPVCQICAGTDADLKEALSRAAEQLGLLTNFGIANAVKIAKAAQLRRRVCLGLIPRPARRKKPAA